MAYQSKGHVAAVVALASMTAGSAVAAVAFQISSESRAFEQVVLSKGSVVEDVAPRPIEIAWTAHHPTGDAIIGPITIRYLSRPQRGARLTQDAACAPYWRELAEGPVGRRVLVTCPGATPPPAPTKDMARLSHLSRLPSLADLGSGLPRSRAVELANPQSSEAIRADQDVDRALSRQWLGQAGRSRAGIEPPPLLPFNNPLGWAVPDSVARKTMGGRTDRTVELEQEPAVASR